MYRLQAKHKGERALIFFGGPSVLENGYEIERLVGQDFVIFLESKALTPRFLEYGLETDYFLMPYPEKCKSTAFQMVVVQAIMAGIDLLPLIKPELVGEYRYVQQVFQELFVKGTKPGVPHKKYIWRPDVFFRDSPFALLSELTGARLITYTEPYSRYIRQQQLMQERHFFELEIKDGPFSPADYYNPRTRDQRVMVSYFRTTNSAAAALFPLLRYMGFSEVYFVGLDMSMLGSMEYAAPFTFRSLRHYGVFHEQARTVFSASFPRSIRGDVAEELERRLRKDGLGGLLRSDSAALLWRLLSGRPDFARPRREFSDLASALDAADIRFVNVYEPYRHAWPVEGIKNISFRQLIDA